ncbi:hypothetical protein K440DRAFT_675799 [Wilcoxina mikolae CBS 423.85]|nr:hypothetical protein K440DRAFT_675799 [Wilcoxina mikolae CBS 423.85]
MPHLNSTRKSRFLYPPTYSTTFLKLLIRLFLLNSLYFYNHLHHQSTTPKCFSRSQLRADVEIRIFADIYHLHSFCLRECSQYFNKSLSETWWNRENTHSGQDGIKYRYTLSIDMTLEPKQNYVQPVSPRSCCHKPEASTPRASRLERYQEDYARQTAESLISETRQLYEELFRCFARQQPRDPAPEDTWDRLDYIHDFISLTEIYCAIPAVSIRVENMLFLWSRRRQTVEIWPVTLLKIAAKIRSPSLYTDAFIHTIGYLLFSDGDPDELAEFESLPKVIKDAVISEYNEVFMTICRGAH